MFRNVFYVEDEGLDTIRPPFFLSDRHQVYWCAP